MKVSIKKLLVKVLARLKDTPMVMAKTYQVTTSTTPIYGAYQWSADITQSGWTPVQFSLIYGNSAATTLGAETFNNTRLMGFCSRSGLAITIRVLYMKV